MSGMNSISTIRQRLGVTQEVLAKALDVTQGNVSFYERGQTVPPKVAKRLIEYASRSGVDISYDDIYGSPRTAKGGAKKQRQVA